MTATVVEQTFSTTLASYNTNGGTYNSAQIGLGPLIHQMIGGSNTTNLVGPIPIGIAHPFEQSTAIPGTFPSAFTWDTVNGIDWVFLVTNATAAATRTVVLYTYTRSTGAFAWHGYVTLTYPTTTNHTARGLRALYRTESTGTVAVSGTAVTGTSTLFSTNAICVGSRIGFGSTNPTAISTWYQISAVGSDTGITLSTTAGTIGSGTAYVIEDLMLVTATTNATTTNGGLFVAKGISFADFVAGGTTIPAATTVDRIKAVYWLADASTETNTIAMGCADEGYVSPTSENIWVPNLTSATTVSLYKYNIRHALTLSSGKDITSLILSTGVVTITSSAPQLNNGCIFAMNSGPGSGLNCLYFCGTTHVYRSNAVSTITSGSTTWLSDSMVENPPGGTVTFVLQSSLAGLEYLGELDKIIVTNSSGGRAGYITQYRTDGGVWDRRFGTVTYQLDQTAADSTTYPYPNFYQIFSCYSNNGILYMSAVGTAATNSMMYAVPISADWEYADNGVSFNYCILPAMNTPNCNKFSRAYFSENQVLGGASGANLGQQPEPVRIYARTAGITNNSGAWTLLDWSGDLSSFGAATQIQFKLEFRMIGYNCIPAQILNVGVVYDDLSTDSHYSPSVTNSSPSTSQFAWRFSTAFGGTVPELRVRLYNAVTLALLVDDQTTAPTGTFAQSTDGGTTWVAWTTADMGNNTTYIRYTPASLATGITVSALLTLF